MTIVLNDPSWWPLISYFRLVSYFTVACLTAVLYDWALTFGSEFELVWRPRWSFMTFLYLSVRYSGIIFTIALMLIYLPSVRLTDAGCIFFYLIETWIVVIVEVMLCVIMISRIYAMYRQSRQVLILLIATFLPIQITRVVIGAFLSIGYTSGEEYILSGAHMCRYYLQEDIIQLVEMTWILTIAWEILALCLALWIAVKHFRELQGPSTRWTAGDYYTILVKTHLFYFASFVAVSSTQLSELSPNVFNSISVTEGIFAGIRLISQVVELFILGPHLILGVREYHANVIANSDEGTAMTSITFEEHVQISVGSSV